MTKRWLAAVHYRSELGDVTVEHDIEELGDIEELVERGPDWNTIEHIEIKLVRISTPGMLLEDQD